MFFTSTDEAKIRVLEMQVTTLNTEVASLRREMLNVRDIVQDMQLELEQQQKLHAALTNYLKVKHQVYSYIDDSKT